MTLVLLRAYLPAQAYRPAFVAKRHKNIKQHCVPASRQAGLREIS
jgi:hypothetical protein